MPTSPPNSMLDGQRFVMPTVIVLMFVIAAVFYVETAKDDVDRYPQCFIQDCTRVN